MKKSYDVKVFNQSFSVKSEADEHYVRQVASFVDQKIREIGDKTPSISSLNVALLTAMNIADEYLKLNRERESKNKKLAKQVKSLIEFVSSQL